MHFNDRPTAITAAAPGDSAPPVLTSTHTLYAITLPDAENDQRIGLVGVQVSQEMELAIFRDVALTSFSLFAPDGQELQPVREMSDVSGCAAIAVYGTWDVTPGTLDLEMVAPESTSEVRVLLERVHAGGHHHGH